MKLQLDPKLIIKDFKGDYITLERGGAPLTLKDMIILAIKTPVPEDTTMSMVDKLDLAKAGIVIFNDGDELPIEQATKLKNRICTVFNSPAVAFAINDIFENLKQVVDRPKD